jgi:hypothetical protein
MSSYDRATELVALLEAADPDLVATLDPRAATPPCVLVTPPAGTPAGTYCTHTVTWSLYALAPGTANADSWKELDRLLAIVNAALPVEQWLFVAYSLAPDAPLVPAYQIQFTEGIDAP